MHIVKNYDPKSYDLAESFLSDEPHLNTEARRNALAQLIQSVIEDYIEEEQSAFVPLIMRAK
jgi:uncharacterized protein YpmS